MKGKSPNWIVAAIWMVGSLAASGGMWQPLPDIPGDGEEAIRDLRRYGNSVWVIAGERVLRFDGKTWTIVCFPEGVPLAAADDRTRFHGNTVRELWIELPGETPRHRRLYQVLKDIRLVCDVECEGATADGLYIRHGRNVYQLGRHSLRTRWGEQWLTTPTELSIQREYVQIADLGVGNPIVFVSARTGLATVPGKGFKRPVPLPGITEHHSFSRRRDLRACALGEDRLLVWYRGGTVLSQFSVGRGKIEPLGQTSFAGPSDPSCTLGGACPDVLGGVFLELNAVAGQAHGLLQISADCDPERANEERVRLLPPGHAPVLECPPVGVHDVYKNTWVCLDSGAVAQIGPTAVQIHTLRDASGPVRVLRLAPGWLGGGVFAATASRVYAWREAPDEYAAAKLWKRARNVSSFGPQSGPEGRVWLVRSSTPQQLSCWDGEKWGDYDLPCAHSAITVVVADNCGRLIAATTPWPLPPAGDAATTAPEERTPPAAFHVGPDGVHQYPSLFVAISKAVDDGASQFSSRAMAGPVVNTGGDVWFAPRYDTGIYWAADGQWTRVTSGRVCALLPWQSSIAAYADYQWHTWEEGRLLPLPGPDDLSRHIRVMLPGYRAPLPYCAALDALFRHRSVPLLSQRPGDYRALVWDAVSAETDLRNLFLSSEAENSPFIRWHPGTTNAASGKSLTLEKPVFCLTDGDGGFWIRDVTRGVLHVRDGWAIQPTGRSTPANPQGGWGPGYPADAMPSKPGQVTAHQQMGFAPNGTAWIYSLSLNYPQVFFSRPAEAVPTRPFHLTVQFDRHSSRLGCGPQPGRPLKLANLLPGQWSPVTTCFRLHGRNGRPWRYFDTLAELPSAAWASDTTTLSALRLQIRQMDPLGILGPPRDVTFTIDRRIPETHWFPAAPPKVLTSSPWCVPVQALWHVPTVKGTIQYRFGKGDWQALPEDRKISLGGLDGQTLRFAFRAVTDTGHVDPTPLNASVHVDFRHTPPTPAPPPEPEATEALRREQAEVAARIRLIKEVLHHPKRSKGAYIPQ